jgi:hypothetical protein
LLSFGALFLQVNTPEWARELQLCVQGFEVIGKNQSLAATEQQASGEFSLSSQGAIRIGYAGAAYLFASSAALVTASLHQTQGEELVS